MKQTPTILPSINSFAENKTAMERLTIYRLFHLALIFLCCLLHWLSSAAKETAEYYEDLYSAGIRYSKFLVILQIFIVLQGLLSSEVLISTFFRQTEARERIPDPWPPLLPNHFFRKFYRRNYWMITAACLTMFFVECIGEDKDGFVRGGMPFLVMLLALKIFPS